MGVFLFFKLNIVLQCGQRNGTCLISAPSFSCLISLCKNIKKWTRWPSFVYVPQPCIFIVSVACVYSVAYSPLPFVVFLLLFSGRLLVMWYICFTLFHAAVRSECFQFPPHLVHFVSPSTASQNNTIINTENL